jgi:hypothetical protein
MMLKIAQILRNYLTLRKSGVHVVESLVLVLICGGLRTVLASVTGTIILRIEKAISSIGAILGKQRKC